MPSFDEFTVLKNVAVLDVNEKTTALTYEHEQTTTGMVILGVLPSGARSGS